MQACRCSVIDSLHRQLKMSRIASRTFVSSTSRMVEYKRIVVREADSIRELFNSKDFKPRKSPTVLNLSKVSLPENFVQYIKRILQHENVPALEEGTYNLVQHLRHRIAPIEEDEYKCKAEKIENEVVAKDSFLEPFLSEEQLARLERSRHSKIKKELRRTIYHWEPINYDHRTALYYMLGRTAPDYAALSRVFHEIKQKDPTFTPKSLLDFGSGIGSVLWAAQNFWPSQLMESVCVDASREMNEIAELLVRRGMASRAHCFPGVYFRQFLPVGVERKFDLTVSSYSLMELPSAQTRMETLDNLWKKTKKYLVLIEPGTNPGFELINEARDFLLQTYRSENTGQDGHFKIAEGHAFAPCPSNFACPRYGNDTTPCNFSVQYRPLLPWDKDFTHRVVFSYLVLKKGPRKGSDEQWPRLVRDPLLRGKHVICRLCTKSGTLSEAILTKAKHARPLYKCARKSNCGDILPVVEVEATDENQEDQYEDDAFSSDSEGETDEDINPSEEASLQKRGRQKSRKREV